MKLIFKPMQVFFFKLFIGSFLMAHPFHVSVCDVEYNPSTQSYEITHKIFLDDLELTLNNAYDLRLDLLADPDPEKLDPILRKYISSNFKIMSEGKALTINHLGSEIEEDVLRYYMEIEDVDSKSEIFIINKILLETYDDQKNLVHWREGEDVFSILLSRDEPGGKIILD